MENEDNPTGEPTSANRNRLAVGVVLIVIGVLAFAIQFVQSDVLGLLFLPALGIVFLTWGIVGRHFGPLVPGGILFGIGLGAFLINVQSGQLSQEDQGGVFLLSFAAGWAMISLIYVLVSRRLVIWPLIVGGILALIGAALVAGGAALDALEWAGRGWPLILIGIGLYLLLWRRGLRGRIR